MIAGIDVEIMPKKATNNGLVISSLVKANAVITTAVARAAKATTIHSIVAAVLLFCVMSAGPLLSAG